MNLPEGSAWNRYRRWRNLLWISACVSVPLVALLSYLHLENGGGVLAILYFFVFLHFLQLFKCPRCHENFFFKVTWEPWSGYCRHCGLPKWKEADHVDPHPERNDNRTPSIREMATDASVSELERHSKFLLLVLRDDPGAIHLKLDENGWADVRELLNRANRYGFKLTAENLNDCVTTSSVQRFEWNETRNRIRASGN
jgi:hypothetical protein